MKERRAALPFASGDLGSAADPFSAVVMVHDPGPARDALTGAYAKLGLAFRPETVGCVADSVPGVTSREVRHQLVQALGAVLSMAPACGGASVPALT